MDGIYRERARADDAALRLLPELTKTATAEAPETIGRLSHPRYQLPPRCFAYVGDATNTRTSHLPYLKADGSVDLRRLPKAVQAILSNYRGPHVTTVPENAIPDVLQRLAQAAETVGKLHDQTGMDHLITRIWGWVASSVCVKT